MKLKHKKEGITLIALVITIIILLILAGVSIAMLTGDNGIIGKAKDAQNDTIVAQEKELIQIAYVTAQNKKSNSDNVTAKELKQELDQLTGDKEVTEVGEAPDVEGNIIVKFNETGNQYIVKNNGSIDDYTGELPPPKQEPTTVEEAKKDNTIFEKNTPLNNGAITIPEGFRIAENSPTDITQGVVVKDDNENEYVWIPCTTTGEGKTINYNAKRDENWQNYQFWYNDGEWGDSQPTTIGSPSIQTYKGFYVARYEAGIPSDALFYPKESNGYKYYKNAINEPTKDTNQYTPVSKKGEPAWNYISQTKAIETAKKMVSNGSVQSYLIDSHAWDTICRVIQQYDSTKSITDSTKWGNYYDNTTTNYESLNTLYAFHSYNSSKELTVAETYSRGKVEGVPKGNGDNRLELSTGASDDFKAFNIYDLAGNMWEWTTENGKRPGSDNSSADIPTIQGTDVFGATQVIQRGSSFLLR